MSVEGEMATTENYSVKNKAVNCNYIMIPLR